MLFTHVEDRYLLLARGIGILNVKAENPPGYTTGKNLVSWVTGVIRSFFYPFFLIDTFSFSGVTKLALGKQADCQSFSNRTA